MESDSSDFLTFRRRYLLRTLGAVGAGALAGCAGDDGSSEPDSSEDDEATENNSTPEETATPEPDYSLPESEHTNPVDMATEWMIFPDDQGDELQAVGLSPSALDENYDTSFAEDIGADEKYDVFEFNHTDIPETYVQHADDPWDSRFKVDQLPNNVSEEDVVQQLEDSGYTKQHQRGDFEVYAGEDGFHAVGNDRHIVVLQSSTASSSKQRDLMFRVLEESNDNRYEIPETMQNGLDKIDVQDSLTMFKAPHLAYMTSTGTTSHQPEMAISSVDFEEGKKYGAWPFQDGQSAESAVSLLNAEENLRYGFSDVELDGRTVTASDANYDLNEMNNGNWLRFSVPRI